MSTHYPVVVVGGGQAGLSVSHYLGKAGIEHVVFERNRIAHNWRTQRWDSFCLVTPNWQCQLPDFPYRGPEPDGFMPKDDIVRYIEDFATAIKAPVREGVSVERLGRQPDGTFALSTSAGDFTASNVVLAVSGYHVPFRPAMAERLPASIAQIHSSAYKSAASLPPGAVLVVGSAQSGCQIAEDLHLEGRQVHLSLGSSPRSPRCYRGKDAITWLAEMGQYEMTVDDHPKGAAVRRQANHYMTGRDGGREIDLRRFALQGMRLHGRLTAIDGERLGFAPDVAAKLDSADAVYCGIRDMIDNHIAARGIEAPTEAPYMPVWQPDTETTALDLADAGITSVVWSTGFRSDWGWVDVPAFDDTGMPAHHRGLSTVAGLSFIGLPWLHTWGSGRFSGVSRDAEHIVKGIVARTMPDELSPMIRFLKSA